MTDTVLLIFKIVARPIIGAVAAVLVAVLFSLLRFVLPLRIRP